MIMKAMHTSRTTTTHWATPALIYSELDARFSFNDDPCPLHGTGGLERPWGSRTYVNPPYGKEIGKWIARAYQEGQAGKLVVMLLPSRTDTIWFHRYILHHAREIIFIKGRLRFNDAKGRAPFPSMVVVFGRSDVLQ